MRDERLELLAMLREVAPPSVKGTVDRLVSGFQAQPESFKTPEELWLEEMSKEVGREHVRPLRSRWVRLVGGDEELAGGVAALIYWVGLLAVAQSPLLACPWSFITLATGGFMALYGLIIFAALAYYGVMAREVARVLERCLKGEDAKLSDLKALIVTALVIAGGFTFFILIMTVGWGTI